jgi:DNA-binding GntR family transcriptional regulator
MRDDILRGVLTPGQRLKFPELCGRYEASVGAIREALAALANQGLVRSVAHRGYTVTPISVEDLMQLVTARSMIEPQVLAMSVRNGGVEWEASAMAAHHVLRRTTQLQGDPPETNPAWAEAHEQFHETLFAACGNERLLDIVRQLGADAALYRRWSDTVTDGRRDVAAEHQGLLDAAVSGDAELAAQRLLDHIQTTAKILKESADSFARHHS